MTAKTHISAGLLVGLVYADTVSHPAAKATIVGASVLGSIVPDIDINQSKISYILFPIRLLHLLFGKVVKLFARLLPVSTYETIARWIAHRGITHSAIYALMMGFIAYLISFQVMIYPMELSVGVMLGILSHIIMDLLSGGTLLFAPLYNKRVGLMDFKTDSFGELIVLLICLLGVAYKLGMLMIKLPIHLPLIKLT